MSISNRTVANYYRIVLSSTTKIYFFLLFISRLIRSFSCGTVALLLKNSSFLYLKALLPSSICLTNHEFSSCRTLARFFKIVLLSTTKIYFLLPFVSRIMSSVLVELLLDFLKLFFSLLQRSTSFFNLFHVSRCLFLVELLQIIIEMFFPLL